MGVNKLIKKEEFESFAEMISGLMKEAINRFKEGRSTSLSQEAKLPLRDIARVYDYSQDYLRNLINRGRLKASKKGKLWYVRVHDMAEYINAVSGKESQ